MVQGTIQQLGVKRPQSKSLPCAKLRGFFYGGGVTLKLRNRLSRTENGKKLLVHRQHLILQTIMGVAGLRGRKGIWKSHTEKARKYLYGRSLRVANCNQKDTEYLTPDKVHSHLFFYDNPSQKRLARCTNIIHTGATLQVWADEQRLRKGFQEWRRELTRRPIRFRAGQCEYGQMCPMGLKPDSTRFISRLESCPFSESLSSAAENKAPSEKYEVMVDITLPCLQS